MSLTRRPVLVVVAAAALLAMAAGSIADLRAQAPTPTPLQNLQASIARITGSTNTQWGIYIKSLETGEEIAINADQPMETMSTIKLALMTEVFEQIKAGKFKLTDKYTFTEPDRLPGTGVIKYLDAGAVLSVKDLISLMVVVSDNTATDVLYRMVGGPDAVNQRMQQLGFTETRAMATGHAWFAALRAAPSAEALDREGKHPFGRTTAREMGRLLEMMERGQLVDKASSDLMLQIMRGQLYRTRIPRYIEGNWRIPHKTGDFLPYVADDVGVLESPAHHVIVSIYTHRHGPGSGGMIEQAIGRVAQQVAEYFEYRN